MTNRTNDLTPANAVARLDELTNDDALDGFMILIDCITESADDSAIAREMTELLAIIRTDTQSYSEFLLSLSICPIHECDYATCFDDEDEECAQLRAAFPNHDT